MLIALSLAISPAQAFTEDLCFVDRQQNEVVDNCYHLDNARCEAGDESPRCRTQASVDVAFMLSNDTNARSMVHVDATYLMAQAFGFTAARAHTIAAYDQAADQGQYIPHGPDGAPLVTVEECAAPNSNPYCAYTTIDVEALDRLDDVSGGNVLHYGGVVNPAASTAGSDGYVAGHQIDAANLDPHSDAMLVHWRNWALTPSVNQVCALGLTNQSPNGDYATGTGCFGDGTQVMTGEATILGGGRFTNDFVIVLEDQVFRWAADGVTPELTAAGFDAEAGRYASEARFGIYLHFAQDRVSHNLCQDWSRIDGPETSGDWDMDYDHPECSAPIHALRHAWEVGYYDATKLTERERTTEHGLALTFDELERYAQLRLQRPRTVDRAQMLSQLETVLSVKNPVDRQQAMTDLMDTYNVDRLPGH
jgi:hypothetical protein